MVSWSVGQGQVRQRQAIRQTDRRKTQNEKKRNIILGLWAIKGQWERVHGRGGRVCERD